MYTNKEAIRYATLNLIESSIRTAPSILCLQKYYRAGFSSRVSLPLFAFKLTLLYPILATWTWIL